MKPLTRTAEFELVCACCAWPATTGRDARIHEIAGAPLDWRRVVEVTRKHRVDGLVAHGLKRTGVTGDAETLDLLSHRGQMVLQLNLAAAAESRRLVIAFAEAGIEILFFKGLSLAKQAYGSIAHKVSRDIDILIPMESVAGAVAAMEKAGYSRMLPDAGIGDASLPEWLYWCKEAAWQHPTHGTIVELHTRLLDNREILPGIKDSELQAVEIAPGISVPTLGGDGLLAYLAAHGAAHAWQRLKWLADFAAIAGQRDEAQVVAFYRFASARGAGRCAAQALLLSSELLDLSLPAALDNELRRSSINRILLRVALGTIAGRGETEELYRKRFGEMPMLLSHFALGSGWRYWRAEIVLKLANPYDRIRGILPPSLAFLYPALGAIRWTKRKLGLLPQYPLAAPSARKNNADNLG